MSYIIAHTSFWCKWYIDLAALAIFAVTLFVTLRKTKKLKDTKKELEEP